MCENILNKYVSSPKFCATFRREVRLKRSVQFSQYSQITDDRIMTLATFKNANVFKPIKGRVKYRHAGGGCTEFRDEQALKHFPTAVF